MQNLVDVTDAFVHLNGLSEASSLHKSSSSRTSSHGTHSSTNSFVGVLDMFGFEDAQVRSNFSEPVLISNATLSKGS